MHKYIYMIDLISVYIYAHILTRADQRETEQHAPHPTAGQSMPSHTGGQDPEIKSIKLSVHLWELDGNWMELLRHILYTLSEHTMAQI